jgi:threonine dehydratase
MNNHDAEQKPSFADIESAYRRIGPDIRCTPVLSDTELNEKLGCELSLKFESLQITGSFKIRGATNAIKRLVESGHDGDIATHSSGNHGAALARAATRAGRKASVVMPENCVKSKVASVRANGGEVIFCPATQKDRENGLARLVASGCIAIPPYDHKDIICGQGTVVIEMNQQCPSADIVLMPVGGGGLISGASIAAKALIPGVKVIGAEPKGAADTALSLEKGERVSEYPVDTIADGLRALVGELNFDIIKTHVDQVVTVSEQGIVDAMALIWKHFRILAEPSSATVVAAIMESPATFAGQKVAAVISGGNVDLAHLPFKIS